ncbi:ABC transporter permease [Ornithinimicrobium sediminis]|uniref:ABC transporter permease n=1 Tax=Ornithinimicrobium sediminis TaxID=2904603 RepID=UPI001E56D3CB|nr:ABC transporter permease [Ornithinimicrobium sediminis]MCE0487550.1 ABC transporter permease [Ornithinimicrobium sediminis]
MSTQTVDTSRPGTDPGRTAREDLGPVRAVPFTRLLRVELRKQADTRAGRWFLVLIAVVTVAILVTLLATGDGSRTFQDYFEGTVTPLQIFLPVLAIMAATSEWSQRTAMSTFTLEPRRGRVVAAKVLASLVLGATLLVVAAALAALTQLAAVLVRGAEADWTVTGWVVGGAVIALTVFLLQGSAFGLALLNTPAAIVAFFALPTALSVVSALIESWRDTMSWIDINQTTVPFFTGSAPTGEQWAQFAVSMAVWVVLPMAIGVWRVLHREVK